MRKTRLLLDAVARAGCQGVTFAALDLCEDSLREALTALQGKHSAVSRAWNRCGRVFREQQLAFFPMLHSGLLPVHNCGRYTVQLE